MQRFVRTVTVGLLLAVATSVNAQTSWEVRTTVDKLTDAEAVTATAQARTVDGSIYELTVRCSGGTRQLTIGTFGRSGAPREIPWTTGLRQNALGAERAPRVVQSWRLIQYRIDGYRPTHAELRAAYSNVGSVYLFGLDMFAESGLPTTRLVIADVFPEEQVEFTFGNLTDTERKTLERLCWRPERNSQEAGSSSGWTGTPVQSLSVESQQSTENGCPTQVSAPVRVGGAIKAPQKTKHVPPVYPAIAQSARIQGVVEIEVTICPNGQIASAKVIKSQPLLDDAALRAVRQWEFTPTLRDGVPVPIVMELAVQFSLIGEETQRKRRWWSR